MRFLRNCSESNPLGKILGNGRRYFSQSITPKIRNIPVTFFSARDIDTMKAIKTGWKAVGSPLESLNSVNGAFTLSILNVIPIINNNTIITNTIWNGINEDKVHYSQNGMSKEFRTFCIIQFMYIWKVWIGWSKWSWALIR